MTELISHPDFPAYFTLLAIVLLFAAFISEAYPPEVTAMGGAADAKANLGTLVPDLENKTGKLVPGMASARCGEDGFLYIGSPPDLGPYVGPGNNYHVYDIPLFWANLRADVAKRVTAWQKQQR